jgi:repressor LexA
MDPNLTERQRQILDFICESRQSQGYFPSLREIGGHFGLSLGTVQSHLDTLKRKGALSWEKGKTRALKVARERLTDFAEAWIRVPLLGRVSAGPGLLAEENVEDVLSLPNQFFRSPVRQVFALRVQGDSMTGAGILDKDTVVVKVQNDAEDGDLVVALVGEEAVVKTLRRERGRVFLDSANPAYPPREMGETSRILGKVVKLLRSCD